MRFDRISSLIDMARFRTCTPGAGRGFSRATFHMSIRHQEHKIGNKTSIKGAKNLGLRLIFVLVLKKTVATGLGCVALQALGTSNPP